MIREKLSHDIAKMAAAKNTAYATDVANSFNPSWSPGVASGSAKSNTPKFNFGTPVTPSTPKPPKPPKAPAKKS